MKVFEAFKYFYWHYFSRWRFIRENMGILFPCLVIWCYFVWKKYEGLDPALQLCIPLFLYLIL